MNLAKIKCLNRNQKQQLIKVGATADVCAFDFNFRHQLHYDKNRSQSLFIEINNYVNINFVSYDDVKDLFKIKKPIKGIRPWGNL